MVMKKSRILFVLLAFILCIGTAAAQTKKTSTSKKKAAPKPIAVYVCTGNNDKLFHKRRTCAGLNKCSGDIKYITSVAELKKWKRKSCTRCNK
jgi:hypothetical protein